jgi:hypothetical protein
MAFATTDGGRAWAADASGLQYGAQVTLPSSSSLGAPLVAAVDWAQNLYVAYSNGSVVKLPKLTSSTGYGAAIRLPFNNLSDPVAIAVDRAGVVFVSDLGLDEVVKVSPVGGGYGPETPVPNSVGYEALGIAVDSTGDLFLATQITDSPTVYELPSNGGPPNTVLTGLPDPVALAVDRNDNLFVLDQSTQTVVEVPWTYGSYTASPIYDALTGVNYPTSVAVDPAGDIFVVDDGMGTAPPAMSQVVELPRSGTGYGSQRTLPFSSLNLTDYNSPGLAVDSTGDVIVATATLPNSGPGSGLIELPRFISRPGAATAIAMGANGTAWALGTGAMPGGYGIYHWAGKSWAVAPGGAVKIAVDPSGNAWVVTTAHQIYHWNGVGWVLFPGAATDIGVGANGSVWVLGTNPIAGNFPIYHWTSSGWTPVSGAAVRIAVDPGGNPWVINSAQQIFHWNGFGWTHYPGAATDIGVGANWSLWVLGNGPVTGGYGLYHWNGSGWTQFPGGAVRIAVDPSGNPWVINSAHQIYSS